MIVALLIIIGLLVFNLNILGHIHDHLKWIEDQLEGKPLRDD